MKKLAFVFLLLGVSCTETSTKNETSEEKAVESEQITRKDFQDLLDSVNVQGSILIFSKDNFYSNNFDWAKKAHLPASTFKIPNSIIALELGVMEDDSTMIPWDGKSYFMKSWEQDLHFRDAFHFSCVPCYQEIARKIGVKRMRKFTDDFNYGKMIFDSASVDMFWLEGESKISQFDQIDFLKRFHDQQLPISERTHEIMSRMMIIAESEASVLRGKTGWSFRNDINNCWFVGYVESGDETHYFATNIQPANDAEMNEIISVRKEITKKALKSLGISIPAE